MIFRSTAWVFTSAHYAAVFLSLLALGTALLVTPAWVLLDEYLLDWSAWLASWPSLISNGLVPLAVVVLGLVALDELVQRGLHASQEERILFIFVFLVTALVVLTAIGIFFRGPGMSLYWPWDIPTAHLSL